MKAQEILETLEGLAKQADVTVRYDALAPSSVTGSGGLCRLRDAWVVVIDKRAPVQERISVLADALSGFDLGEQLNTLPKKLRVLLRPDGDLSGAVSGRKPAVRAPHRQPT